MLAIIRAHPELFEIANHTMYHCDLVRGGGGSPSTGAVRRRPVQRRPHPQGADRCGGDPRAPAPARTRSRTGARRTARSTDGVLDAAASVGYTKTFLWDIDTIDWKPISDGGPTAEQIAAKVIGNAVNGSNVLFHLGGYETLDSLRLIVPGLRDRGFTLTSLSDLLN